MITKIRVENMRGQTKTVALGKKTIITGDNGAGKSTLIHAAQLVVMGFIPGQGKKPADIFANASASPMSVAGVIDEHDIVRTYMKRGDSVSSGVMVDGVSKGNVEQAIGKNRVFDAEAFWLLSDRLKRIEILKCVCDEKTLADVIDKPARLRESVNAIRAQVKAEEESRNGLSAELGQLPTVAGTAESIRAQIKTARADLEVIRQRITDGEAADNERVTLRAKIENRKKTKEEHEALLVTIDKAKSDTADIDNQIAAVKRRLTTLRDATMAEHVVKELVEIEAAIRQYPSCHHDDTKKDELADRIKALIDCRPQGDDIPLAVKRIEELERSKDKITSELTQHERRRGILLQQLTDGQAAEKRLLGIGPGVTQEDRAAKEGLQAKITEMEDKERAAIRRQTITDEIEKRRIKLEKLADDEAKAKKDLEAAESLQRTTVQNAKDTLAERAAMILPPGQKLEIRDNDGALFIGLDTRQRDCLSGGERVIFDAAFARAVAGPNATVFLDAGECSNTTLRAVMENIEAKDHGQVVIARWTDNEVNLGAIDATWTVVQC